MIKSSGNIMEWLSIKSGDKIDWILLEMIRIQELFEGILPLRYRRW